MRLFLVLALTLGWYTCTLDFNNAFCQTELATRNVWVHVPRGFHSKKGKFTCLHLNRTLYGLSFAPRAFFTKLTAALKAEGFTQSKYDACLFFKPNMLLVLYVDDCGVAAKIESDIDALVDKLRARGFDLSREGSFTKFLGLKVERANDKSITLTQPALIEKVIKTTGLENCNPNHTPTKLTALGSDPDGEPMDEPLDYRSVTGMLLFLATNTRIDICLAVSQIARFANAPKKSHATAVKTIVRYLQKTKTKGMCFTPTGTLDLDAWVDADFCGLFVRSLTGS